MHKIHFKQVLEFSKISEKFLEQKGIPTAFWDTFLLF